MLFWVCALEESITTAWRRFFVQRKDGGATSVYVTGDGSKPMFLVFEKKIGRDDVVDGKLVSAVDENVKRRGGKRHTTVCVSYEGAEALYKALKPALKEIRRRRRARVFVGRMYAVIESMVRLDRVKL